jgi:two-component system CheB/CheR fusion protein
MNGRRPTKADLERRVRDLEALAAERERLLFDLEVHREEIRIQNERLRETQGVVEESRDRYADLFDFAPVGYLSLDRFGVIRELNLTAAGLLGSPRGHLLGLPLLNRIASGTRPAFLEHMLRCREGQTPVVTEVELERQGVRTSVELASRTASRGSRGEVLTTMTDLTERNRGRAERERLLLERERERAASEAKGRFLAMLSHELRTPLTPILALVSAMQRDEAYQTGELRDKLAMIRRNVELEARLIDDLLDLSRIEHDKLRLDLKPVDAHELLQRLVDDAAGLPSASALSLSLEPAAADSVVLADASRLQQVVWNLLGNAVKFTPPGGRVTVRTSNPQPRLLEIAVCDTGIGIEPAMLTTLFTPFSQASGAAPGSGTGGLGLGLAIARKLVEAHGGTIEATTGGPGLGSTLTLRLPTPATVTVPAAPAPALAERPEPLRLLLVEDHPDTADALAQLLSFEGFEVTVAGSVQAAIAAARPEHEVLVSDLALPDGNGYGLLRKLRAAGHQLPAVALSGFGAEDDKRQSRDAGFAEHLTKPVEIQTLLDAIQRIHRGHAAAATGASAPR